MTEGERAITPLAHHDPPLPADVEPIEIGLLAAGVLTAHHNPTYLKSGQQLDPGTGVCSRSRP
jgi:hypothetical protein